MQFHRLWFVLHSSAQCSEINPVRGDYGEADYRMTDRVAGRFAQYKAWVEDASHAGAGGLHQLIGCRLFNDRSRARPQVR
jgi:hypothetical protein